MFVRRETRSQPCFRATNIAAPHGRCVGWRLFLGPEGSLVRRTASKYRYFSVGRGRVGSVSCTLEENGASLHALSLELLGCCIVFVYLVVVMFCILMLVLAPRFCIGGGTGSNIPPLFFGCLSLGKEWCMYIEGMPSPSFICNSFLVVC